MNSLVVFDIIYLVIGPLGSLLDLIVESIYDKTTPWAVLQDAVDSALAEDDPSSAKTILTIWMALSLICPFVGWIMLKNTIKAIRFDRKERS